MSLVEKNKGPVTKRANTVYGNNEKQEPELVKAAQKSSVKGLLLKKMLKLK